MAIPHLSVVYFTELKTVKLMKDLDWDKLLTTTPYFVPNPDNDTDTTYFEGM